jgi:hypothetical protein
MCTGGAYRPFLHDRHFSAASSFQIGVIARTPDRIGWRVACRLINTRDRQCFGAVPSPRYCTICLTVPRCCLQGHALASETRKLASLLGRPGQPECGLYHGARLLRRTAKREAVRALWQGDVEGFTRLGLARHQRASTLHEMRHGRLRRYAPELERGYQFQQRRRLMLHLSRPNRFIIYLAARL